jgi:hypothetical protein
VPYQIIPSSQSPSTEVSNHNPPISLTPIRGSEAPVQNLRAFRISDTESVENLGVVVKAEPPGFISNGEDSTTTQKGNHFDHNGIYLTSKIGNWRGEKTSFFFNNVYSTMIAISLRQTICLFNQLLIAMLGSQPQV